MSLLLALLENASLINNMIPHIACEPPLGQVTVVDATTATFFVALKLPPLQHEKEAHPYNVAIWHDGHDEARWGDLLLESVS